MAFEGAAKHSKGVPRKLWSHVRSNPCSSTPIAASKHAGERMAASTQSKAVRLVEGYLHGLQALVPLKRVISRSRSWMSSSVCSNGPRWRVTGPGQDKVNARKTRGRPVGCRALTSGVASAHSKGTRWKGAHTQLSIALKLGGKVASSIPATMSWS